MSERQADVNPVNLAFVEELFAAYQKDAASVAPEWREYFAAWGNGRRVTGPSFRPWSIFNPPSSSATLSGREVELGALQHRVDQLIRNYRVRGHIIARTNPLGLPHPMPPELEPARYGFSEADMDRPFACETFASGGVMTLREIMARLENTYCRSIGVQFMHIDDLSVREWLQRRMETSENHLLLSRAEQLRILSRLSDAVVLEEFIQKKFIGAKSFSLEGSESLIPLLDLAIEHAGGQGVREIVLGMAHRGRLNVLANIMRKSPAQIFREFEDKDSAQYLGRGDVKYHQGYSYDWTTAAGQTVHLSLCFNPSHLEFVNPVALGRMRAKQDRADDRARERGLVLLIHGEAGFCGQGIVQETLNLSQLPGYSVGGTLHVVLNNQVGFTTTAEQARSSIYATDVAKMLQVPIFHVNGEDPEAVAQAVRLGLDFRKTFRRDVVIEMVAYRRRGHNEGDEPSFTQPLLYRAIAQRKSVRDGYLEHLLKLGEVTHEEADAIMQERRAALEKNLAEARRRDWRPPSPVPAGIWQGYAGGPPDNVPEAVTGVPRAKLSQLLLELTRLPEDFHLHPKLVRWMELRREMARGERPLDWAAAEALAFASLAVQGHRVRLSGQDSERGTFSQRHAVLHDFHDGRTYAPLAHLSSDQAPVEILNSPLSEAGVLGFEYGYSLDCPDGLVAWEAQFGDFSNAAQVVIDQFIAGAEDKWRRLSGIVLLLPHGLEGQGPEHASARLERYLVLAAENNIQVVHPSAPAQYFHVLRRQVLRRWRKPLVVITPKSMLRHPRAVSNLDELAEGAFQRVIPDVGTPRGKASHVLVCAGKLYYELLLKREQLRRADVPILRLEQYYPLPEEELRTALSAYPEGTPVYWVQEEPENMGAWRFLLVNLGRRPWDRYPFAGITRPAAASPATGSAGAHKLEEEALINRAFNPLPGGDMKSPLPGGEMKSPLPRGEMKSPLPRGEG